MLINVCKSTGVCCPLFRAGASWPGAIGRDRKDPGLASGTYCSTTGPELTVAVAESLRAVSVPGMTPGAGARRFTYRRVPYGGARIPKSREELVVDGKVLFLEDGPLLNFSRQYAGERMRTLFIPAARVMLISREDSAWQDVNDRPST